MDKIDANTRNWIIGGVVAIVVIVLGWWLFTKPSNTAMTDESSTSSAATTSAQTASSSSTNGVTTSASGEEVAVANQPAGDSVNVTGVSVSKTSWVSVRDQKSILGAKRIEPGAYDVVTVPLLRNTASGESYEVQLFVDDGDQIFDWKQDALVEGVGGAFSATNGD